MKCKSPFRDALAMNIANLELIAGAQRRLIHVALLNLLAPIILLFALAALPGSWTMQARSVILYSALLLLNGLTILLVVGLMRAVGEKTWAIAVAAVFLFLPWVSVVVLLVVNRRATKILRGHRLRVGMLGVSREELRRLALGPPDLLQQHKHQ